MSAIPNFVGAISRRPNQLVGEFRCLKTNYAVDEAPVSYRAAVQDLKSEDRDGNVLTAVIVEYHRSGRDIPREPADLDQGHQTVLGILQDAMADPDVRQPIWRGSKQKAAADEFWVERGVLRKKIGLQHPYPSTHGLPVEERAAQRNSVRAQRQHLMRRLDALVEMGLAKREERRGKTHYWTAAAD